MSESWCYPAGVLKTGKIQQRSGSYLEVMKTQQTESSVAVYPVRRQCPRFQASGYTEAVQSWLRPGSSRIPRLRSRANALLLTLMSTGHGGTFIFFSSSNNTKNSIIRKILFYVIIQSKRHLEQMKLYTWVVWLLFNTWPT